MKKLVAESLFELYGPGYVSDLASGNAKKKKDDGFKHDTKRPFPPESDEEKEKFDQSDFVGADNKSGIGANGKIAHPHEPLSSKEFYDDFKKNYPKDEPTRRGKLDPDVPKKSSKEYTPRPGSAAEAIINFLNKGGQWSLAEIVSRIGGGRSKGLGNGKNTVGVPNANIWHAIQFLAERGVIKEDHLKNPRSGRMANMYSAKYTPPTGKETYDVKFQPVEDKPKYVPPTGKETYDVGPKRPYNDDDDQNTGADGPADSKEVPYVNLKGKPHGYKTYALLKAINDSPDGFSRTQIQKFLVDGTYGQGTWDKAVSNKDETGGNPYRGYWGMALSQYRGFLSQYLTKENPEMVKRKSQAFGNYGGNHMETAMTRKGKWILSSIGKATLKKYEQKFGE